MKIATSPLILEKALKIDGYMQISELQWLAQMAQVNRRIIEVGCFKGRSTRALLDNCSGIIYAVDTYNGPFKHEDGSVEFIADDKLMKEFLDNVQDCHNLNFYRGTLSEFVEDTPTLPVDMVFIDGNHFYKNVKEDIIAAKAITRSGGIISGHDYGQTNWPGVKKAVDEIFPYNINLHESIWWTRV